MNLHDNPTLARKVKSVAELREIIGPFPRDKKIIMCHGTFDVVHPGHLRHLIYAKGKGDTLIASLTADEYVTKGTFRPFVPEELRALNLAALEIVDYVIIDRNSTPLENIAVLQPDYFAKGYEYVDGGFRPRTQDESDVVEGYGGEMIFTPGDIVYSSSHLIDLSPPSIGVEKLLMLMSAEGVTFRDLRRTLAEFAGVRAHVVGDTIVDSYSHCTLIGGNTKTPTFSVRFDDRTDFTGGAGVVAKHLARAGAEVTLTTVLGDDPLKDRVLADLGEAGVACDPVVDATRPTVNKNVFVAGNYHLLKVDTLDNRTISHRHLDEFRGRIRDSRADAMVFSDFRHGIFDRRTIPLMIEAIPDGVYRVADSQVATRWGNITEFTGFDLITPNEREARFALGDQDSGVRPLALELYTRANCRTLILKLGDRGSITYRAPNPDDVRSFFVLDSFADTVVDAVGAGDALLAYSTLAMVRGGNEFIASLLGSLAAAIECEHEGNVPVARDDMLRKIDLLEQRANFN